MQIKKSVCMWCHNHCQVQLTIKNGRLVKQEANADHPRAEKISRNAVNACLKARKAAEYFHHPDRLNFPLKRAGEKGEGKWEQISWEQALDEIAGKLKDIIERYGPEAVSTSSGTGRSHDEYRTRFFNLLGSPTNVGMSYICYGPGAVASLALTGYPIMLPSMSQKTKCYMYLGHNPEQSATRAWSPVLKRVKAGEAKLIVVDPRKTVPAEKADIWLQPRPGTDAALLMAMINTIISEELYDKDFVRDWCYGFDKLAERAQEYPPEKVSEITWVPANKIREAARMYATNTPGVITHTMGIEHQPNCIEAINARIILTGLTGSLDVRGGEDLRIHNPKLRSEHEIELNHMVSPEQRAKQIGADRFRIESFIGFDLLMEHVKVKLSRTDICFAHAGMVYEAMITGEPYPVRAMLTLSSNPIVTHVNTKKVYKALKSLDLYVVQDFFMTPSADLADYVLPGACWLERPCIFNFWDSVPYLDVAEEAFPPSVEGQYDRRTDYDLYRGLGIRLGQEKYWPWKNLEEALNYRLEPLGMTVQEIMDKHAGFIPPPPRVEKRYEKEGFGTPTGKFELYSTILEKLGYDPLPRFYEPVESPVSNPELAKEYPLVLITGGRHLPFYHSEWRQVDSARKKHPHPLVQINPKTASELGIEDGDWVWIESPRGRVRQKCRYFEGIDPRVVHGQHGWWFPELPGEEPWLHGLFQSNINVLTTDDPDQCNPINGGWPMRTLMCRVYKAKQY
ncbi:MAG: molybdopterin-dependent oxidoreductase [Pseudomonadota bacterium]